MYLHLLINAYKDFFMKEMKAKISWMIFKRKQQDKDVDSFKVRVWELYREPFNLFGINILFNLTLNR